MGRTQGGALVGGLLAALMLSVAAARPPAQDRPDQQLAREVARQVDTYSQFTIFDDICGQVENGVVTLTGKVTMPYKKNDIDKRVRAITGVREVRNEIDVLPVSTFDEDLRKRIARAIYSNPAFWQYAARANPPIHIIVEHGRVTLSGTVNNDVERSLARSLATGFGELSVTNALKTASELTSPTSRPSERPTR
jgi:hyperosmotically inducible protein